MKSIGLAALLLIAAMPARADDAPADAKAEMAAFFASRYLKDLLEVQERIKALPEDEHAIALLITSGSLNQKIEYLMTEFAKDGRVSKRDAMLGASLALARLADLAQQLHDPRASQCHFLESRNMRLASEGDEIRTAACRGEAYPADVQVQAMANAYTPEVRHIGELANTWATKAIMFGWRAAELDQRMR